MSDVSPPGSVATEIAAEPGVVRQVKPVGGESGPDGDVLVTVVIVGPGEEVADGDTEGTFDGDADTGVADDVEGTLAAAPAQPVRASESTRVIAANVARDREVGRWEVTSGL